ncbi:MAG TPA: exodeoxyribonuclease VII small subunit [Myxococcota bacterium]|jgi:exodeoxyribonuclease VII small subunit
MPARRTSPKPEADSAAELSFESAMERLEGIVDRLESGELPLEEALAAFEEGVALSRRCAGELDAAERRIEVLVEQGGALATEPFDEPLDGGAGDQS